MDNNDQLIIPRQLEGKDCLRYIKYGRVIRGITKKNYLNNVERTNLLFNEIYALSQNIPENLYKYRLLNTKNATPKQIWISKKLQKLQAKYQSFYSDFYLAEASTLSQLICFIKDNQDQNNLVIFRCTDYRTFIENKFNNNPIGKSILFRICSLDQLAFRIQNETKYPNITEKTVHDSLITFQTLIESKNDYSPFSVFDDIFYSYIHYTNLVSLFDEQVKEITKELKKSIIIKSKNTSPKKNVSSIDFSGISFIYEGLKSFINPLNPLQETVLRYTIIRFFFDRLYLACPFFDADIDKTQFYDKCKKVPELQCSVLKISDKILPAFSSDKRFVDVAKAYKDSLDLLTYIQFYNDPLTIAWLSSKAMHYIEKAIFEAKQPKKREMMAFDDIFSIFWPLMCMCPMADPVSPALFLKCVSKISFPSGLDYARNVFVSAVDYIRDLDLEKLSK